MTTATSAPEQSAATLELRHVSKTYPGATVPAIAGLSLSVPAGEVCVLVGPSGCGKTTALRLVNRMTELSGGEILLDGRPVRDRDPAELRREIGYAIQQVGLFPHRTVAENIATVPRLLGWPRARVRARVDELIVLIGLDPAAMRDRYPAQLSGGQRQRVGVARALAADPLLLLMDEPFGALDPINRERLQLEFLRLQRELRKTVVFVTHDIDEAIRLGDRIAILRGHGELAQYAPPAELLMHPADPFVAGFVGADRALKRLALARVGELEVEPDTDAGLAEGEVRVGEDTSVRDALSAILEHGADRAVVLARDGRPCGTLPLAAITRFLSSQAHAEPAAP
ncbi:MAG TPA: ABC transporter ATP-binding protein [Solirubrobacteraceae bacterium]|nr:ABC transporter ATP-binding protein [Solirubrobacteraceae bacterium]